MDSESSISLEERIARLEGRIGWGERAIQHTVWTKAAIIVASILALVFLILALEMPNHAYQYGFGILMASYLTYHCKHVKSSMIFLVTAFLLNVACLTMIAKLFLGAGVVHPMSWVKAPSVSVEKSTSSWNPLSTPGLQWNETALTGVELDLTKFQSFLMLITVVSAFFSFQPFSSLSAFLLMIISLPSIITSEWNFLLLGVLLLSVSVFLQKEGVEVV